MFGLVVVPMSLIDLQEQVVVQVAMSAGMIDVSVHTRQAVFMCIIGFLCHATPPPSITETTACMWSFHFLLCTLPFSNVCVCLCMCVLLMCSARAGHGAYAWQRLCCADL